MIVDLFFKPKLMNAITMTIIAKTVIDFLGSKFRFVYVFIL